MSKRNTEYELWGDEDQARLKEAWDAGGIVAARAAFPDRGPSGVYRKLVRMGLAGRSEVSPEDAETIRRMWGTLSLREIARAMGRTEVHILNVVKFRLGLKVAVPPGWEYLGDAAERAGYDIEGLKTVLRFYRVPMRPTACSSGTKTHRMIVESEEVDRAAALWARLETVKEAADRHGLFDGQLKRWLVDAGHKRPDPKKRWRMPAEAFDAVVRDRTENFESVEAAAARVGVSMTTLSKWLRHAGVARAFPRSGVRRSAVDAAVKAWRARRRPGVTSLVQEERA